MNEYLLGIVASFSHDMDKQRGDYMTQMIVSQDIINWLDAHDTRVDSLGRKIYICNEIEYIYLGPKPVTMDVNQINLFEQDKKFTA